MKPIFGLAMMLILSLWLRPALADVHESRDAIVTSTVKTIIETIPTSGADLPDFLETPRDVYVFITVGAAYTDIKVLGQASVPPIKLADALDASLAGTALAGQRVEWSADDYAAAHVALNHGHIGLRSAHNTVPIAAVIAGMQRAGFTPHLLLRTPLYAPVTALPPPAYRTTSYGWYDAKQVGKTSTITLTAAVTSAEVAFGLLFLGFVPIVGVTSLLLANRIGRDDRLSLAARRLRYRRAALYPVFGAIALHFPLMMFYLRTPHWRAISDLWFSGSTTAVFPFLMIGPLVMLFLLPLSRQTEKRLLGSSPTAPVIEMLPEEKLIHKRMAAWNFVPHLLAVVVFVVVFLVVPSKSAHYRSISSTAHMLIMFLPLPATIIVGGLYKKRLDAFVTKTVDDDLTLRARQIGMQMQERPHNVFVESSSRANQLATVTSDLGGHIVISQKLRDILTPDEMDFVLAKQVAQMKRGRRMSPLPIIILLIQIPFGLLIYAQLTHRIPVSSSLTIMPYFMIGLFALMLLTLPLIKKSTQESEALTDQEALRVTGNFGAAELALVKMAQATPITSELQEPVIHADTGIAISPELLTRLMVLHQASGLDDGTDLVKRLAGMQSFGAERTENTQHAEQDRGEQPFGYTERVNLFRKKERP